MARIWLFEEVYLAVLKEKQEFLLNYIKKNLAKK